VLRKETKTDKFCINYLVTAFCIILVVKKKTSKQKASKQAKRVHYENAITNSSDITVKLWKKCAALKFQGEKDVKSKLVAKKWLWWYCSSMTKFMRGIHKFTWIVVYDWTIITAISWMISWLISWLILHR